MRGVYNTRRHVIFVAPVERARAWADVEQIWLDVTTVALDLNSS
jgi:hypothetical protein